MSDNGIDRTVLPIRRRLQRAASALRRQMLAEHAQPRSGKQEPLASGASVRPCAVIETEHRPGPAGKYGEWMRVGYG